MDCLVGHSRGSGFVIPMEKPNNRALFKSSEWSYESDSESSSSWRRSTYIVRTCNCKNPCTRTMPLWKAGQSCSQAVLSRHICLLRNASGTTTIDIVPLRFGTRQARHWLLSLFGGLLMPMEWRLGLMWRRSMSHSCDSSESEAERHNDCSAFHRPILPISSNFHRFLGASPFPTGIFLKKLVDAISDRFQPKNLTFY